MWSYDTSQEEQIKNEQLKAARDQAKNYKATKMSRQQLKLEADVAIDRMIELYGSSKWERIYDKPCQLYAMNIPNRMIAKASITLSASLQQIQDLIECQKQYLPATVTQNKVIEKDFYGELRYRFGKAVWPIHDRDMVMVRAKRNDGKRLVVAFKSVDYDVPLQAGTIRVEIYVSGFLIDKISESQCRYTNLAYVDPKGAIPYFLKNKMVEMQGKMPLKIKHILENRRLIKNDDQLRSNDFGNKANQ